MSEVAFTTNTPGINHNHVETFIQWTGLVNGDTGAPFKLGQYTDRTVQLTGTLGTGGEMTFQGSLDGGVTWFTLNDFGNTDIVLSALGGVGVGPASPWVRPKITNGDGSTSLNVYFYGVKKPW